jgi:hypothetical protein
MCGWSLGEQLVDGGWNCETESGSVRASFAMTICVLEGCSSTSGPPVVPRGPMRRAVDGRNTCSHVGCSSG